MPEERERPRPHGDPLETAVHVNPKDNRPQASEEIPHDDDWDSRGLSDGAKGRGSSANGIPEFDEDAGAKRRKQYDDGAEIVSGID
jgi:hypothetical protein